MFETMIATAVFMHERRKVQLRAVLAVDDERAELILRLLRRWESETPRWRFEAVWNLFWHELLQSESAIDALAHTWARLRRTW